MAATMNQPAKTKGATASWCLGCCALLLAYVLTGCISPRRLPGDVVPGATPTPTPPGTATGKLYVSNQTANSILRFDGALTANGNVGPNVTISGSNTQLNA